MSIVTLKILGIVCLISHNQLEIECIGGICHGINLHQTRFP